MSDSVKEDWLLYRDTRFDKNKNKVILKATINYIKNTVTFSGYLFDKCFITDKCPTFYFLPIIQTT